MAHGKGSSQKLTPLGKPAEMLTDSRLHRLESGLGEGTRQERVDNGYV